ncbi:hypothetical protein PAXINDRAFT_12029 [Paxillus involutus ATCC 200175]|uniref:Uncharacterized protein n=1 Tax=Paxillus involutus ATCC 200175 TaxID=664439 RepID=A0A0C9THF8_PAXIN|nr:hypothetical protein PAXINDRAFT_12029 [Paxillus involutus ATCC 200175]
MIGEQRTAAKGPDEGVTDQTASSQKDDGGEDVQVPHAHVVPQHPTSTRQTAVSEAAGTSNPNPNGAGTTMPDVRHTYVVPSPTPPTSKPPPSTPLEGEKGQQSSGHAEETVTHQVEPPPNQSRTTPPKRTPYDRRSNGEGRGVAIGHRQAVREEDEVGGKDDDRHAPYGVDEAALSRSRACEG